jgi:hypothetical protein
MAFGPRKPKAQREWVTCGHPFVFQWTELMLWQSLASLPFMPLAALDREFAPDRPVFLSE